MTMIVCVLLGYALAFFIVGGKENRYMLSVGGAAFADVDCYIEHDSFDTSHEFALGEWRSLEMQTSHHTIR